MGKGRNPSRTNKLNGNSNDHDADHVADGLPSRTAAPLPSKLIPSGIRNGKPNLKPRKKSPTSLVFSKTVLILCIVVILAGVGGYYGWQFYEENANLSPFPAALIPLDRSYTSSLLWGTYRPGTYFGVKSRTMHSVDVGLMWFSYSSTQFGFHHLCDQNAGVFYGWQVGLRELMFRTVRGLDQIIWKLWV